MESACILALAISPPCYVYTSLITTEIFLFISGVDYASLLAEVRNANIVQKLQHWFLPIKVVCKKQLEKEFPQTQVCFI